MRRLVILIAVFVMIVFNGIAFNVLDNSHGHSDGDNHDEASVKSENGGHGENPEKEGHGDKPEKGGHDEKASEDKKMNH